MIFYDFEVFKDDWLTVILDMDRQKETVIVNDPEQLVAFYFDHNQDIWVGFNNSHYDDWILKYICTYGKNPKKLSDFIIKQGKPGWKFDREINNLPLVSYDVMERWDRGLKWFEGSMGASIVESKIPFDISRKLTDAEIQEVVTYCRHDVEQTVEVFLRRQNDFNAVVGLINTFDVLSLNDIGLTKAQLSAKILGCRKIRRNDEYNLSVLPCIRINKYQRAVNFFKTIDDHMFIDIANVTHTIGWGGIHGGKEKYHLKAQGRQIWHIDVSSFYPRLMIFHRLLTRNASRPRKFKEIYEKRIALKKAGKKKEQQPLKIVINSTFGISKSATSPAYDPLKANMITMNGQLMLIDLIEHLEQIDDFELIQSNTDGLIISIPDTDAAFDQMDDICYEWEKRCDMELDFDEISEIWQKDVNNYVYTTPDGHVERKGAYVKELSDLDYDLPIINKAVVDRIVDGVLPEQTIRACDDLKEFQMIRHISAKYDGLYHGGQLLEEKRVNPATGRMKTHKRFIAGKRLKERCVRVFASIDSKDGGLYKHSPTSGTFSKVAGTPEHCFIFNEAVNGAKCPAKLDKQWYIDEANKRLKGYGIGDAIQGIRQNE